MAKDRRIYVNLMFPKWYRAVCRLVRRPDLLEPPWDDPEHREAAGLEFVRELEASLAARSAEEILTHEHVTNSGLLLDAHDAAGRAVTIFDLPFQIDGGRGAALSGPVPALGEHTDSVMAGTRRAPS
jgi:crotonobetainyl-CoA:carnitine CoA-transferase CaiB-like acyl-CoA transferase